MLKITSASEKPNAFNSQFKKERPIWISLIILALPVALFLLFQHLGSSIDYYIVGDAAKQNAGILNSVIAYMKQIKKVLQSIAVSLAGAGIIFVAREYKQKNYKKARQYATLSFIIAVLGSFGIFFIFYLGACLPSHLGDIFLKRDYHSDGGFTYYTISLLSFVFITINSVFIGLEKSKNKNTFVLFLNILNIISKIIFTFLYKHIHRENITLIHLAWTDFLSNFIISLIAFYLIFRPKNDFRLQFNKLIFPKDIIKNILKLSGVLVIGKTTYEIGKKFVNDMVTSYYGKEMITIIGFVSVVNGIIFSISQSFEDAEIVMVSQRTSQEKNQKTLKIFKNVFVITLIIGIIGILVNTFYGTDLLKFLTKSDNQEQLSCFRQILFFEQMSLFTSIWASMMMFYIMSYKKKAYIVLWLNILRIVTRIFCIWFFHHVFYSSTIMNNYVKIGLSTCISNIIVLLVTIILFLSFIKKQKKIEWDQK